MRGASNLNPHQNFCIELRKRRVTSLRRPLAFLCFCLFSPASLRAAEVTTPATPTVLPPITSRFLYFDDELHTYELALLEAKSHLKNMQTTLASLVLNCDHIKDMARKGHTPTPQVKTCTYEVEQKKSELELHVLHVTALERSKEIAEISRTSDTAGSSSIVDLAARYVSKWKDELLQASIRTKMAERRLDMEKDMVEYSKRMYRKGYITYLEYDSAISLFQRVQTELDAAMQKQAMVKKMLLDAEKNLEAAKKL